MAEASQQKVTAAFPPPPPFWKHFTPQNLEKLEELKKEAQGQAQGEHRKQRSWSTEALRALNVPPELRFLVPPEPPSSGAYSLFGEIQTSSTKLPSLKEQGIEQLYPAELENSTSGSGPSKPSSHAYYLLKISKSLLLNFLELVGLLSICPERFEPKLADIRNLFINAHHLLNLYRPHQARESLISMMEEQLQRTKDEIREMDKVKERVESFLRELEAEGREAVAGASTTKSTGINSGLPAHFNEAAFRKAKQMWDLLDSFEEG
ncbi:hypothetical protein VTO42DRAFT_8191 [Malbranchea cinnamomea]